LVMVADSNVLQLLHGQVLDMILVFVLFPLMFILAHKLSIWLYIYGRYRVKVQ
jgi:hypothetical protein